MFKNLLNQLAQVLEIYYVPLPCEPLPSSNEGLTVKNGPRPRDPKFEPCKYIENCSKIFFEPLGLDAWDFICSIA